MVFFLQCTALSLGGGGGARPRPASPSSFRAISPPLICSTTSTSRAKAKKIGAASGGLITYYLVLVIKSCFLPRLLVAGRVVGSATPHHPSYLRSYHSRRPRLRRRGCRSGQDRRHRGRLSSPQPRCRTASSDGGGPPCSRTTQ